MVEVLGVIVLVVIVLTVYEIVQELRDERSSEGERGIDEWSFGEWREHPVLYVDTRHCTITRGASDVVSYRDDKGRLVRSHIPGRIAITMDERLDKKSGVYEVHLSSGEVFTGYLTENGLQIWEY